MTSKAPAPELGFDLPAVPGLAEQEIQTPCLVLDLAALERNLEAMRQLAESWGVRLRPHAKMHKSVDVARLQQRIGGAAGICCQKVSEAEVFVRAGLGDVLVSNQVRDPVKLDRLARLPRFGARIGCCVDDLDNVDELATAVARHDTALECLVELDCGAGRCGVATPAEAVRLAVAIDRAPGLTFAGLQAYHGSLQHLPTFTERRQQAIGAQALVRSVRAALAASSLDCSVVSGGGTGSCSIDGESGVYTELQCGSYAFMDADYGRLLTADGRRLDQTWSNALFVLTSVMSRPAPTRAVCDAGLKALSLDSGLPLVWDRPGVEYLDASDEHGTLSDPRGELAINQRLRLVPGHCDPTCNLHDWYVGVRGGVVECVWPVSARGKSL